jgi:hypothetical protein
MFNSGLLVYSIITVENPVGIDCQGVDLGARVITVFCRTHEVSFYQLHGRTFISWNWFLHNIS